MVADSLKLNDSAPRPLWSAILTKRNQCIIDVLVLTSAFILAYLLRFDFTIPEQELKRGLVQLPLVVGLQFGVLFCVGIYAFIWRYIGLPEIKNFLLAALLSALPLVLLRVLLPDEMQDWRIPFSIILTDTMLAYGGVLGTRVLRRAMYERYEKRQRSAVHSIHRVQRPVLMIGAGRAGVLAAREIQSRGDSDICIKGFIDDDPNKQRAVIQGIKVLGTTRDLPRLVRELEIDHVVISIVRASRQDFRRILDICEQIPIRVRVVPSLFEILHDRVKVSRIRDVQIEDLLGREPVQLEEENLMEFLTARRVLVTGAGGSIGSELSRQVARFQPATLLLVERSEFALFNIERELQAAYPQLRIIPLLADIGDEPRMRSIFTDFHPEVVLHAAAHKHVPMMEYNPFEAVKNNVLATRLLGELAGEAQVGVFVLISTDKAVRPTSVMGATKRVAELVVQDLNRSYQTRYVAVRFGNVIGSAGSVIPIFREQIKEGGPVTVTHPEMKRYFMTIPEAAQLVLQAAVIGQGGEIFILDMGEPMSVLELAKATITLSGLRPFEDIEIVFTGLRAGEKLFEELETSEERVAKTRHPKIFIGKIAPYPQERVERALFRLKLLCNGRSDQQLRVFLNELLPEAQLNGRDHGKKSAGAALLTETVA